MAGVWFTLLIVGLLMGAAADASAAPDLGTQVEKLATQAGATAKDAAADWVKQIRADPWTWLHLIGGAVALAALWFLGVLKKDSLSAGGPRKVESHPTVIWLASGALAFLAMVAGGVIAASTLGITPGSSSLRDAALLQLGNYAISVPTALLLARLMAMSAPDSGMTVKPPDFTKGIFALLLAWPLVQCTAIGAAWVTVKFGGPAPSDVAHSTLAALQANGRDPWALALAACAVLGAPIVEEFIFRGCLQSALVGLFGRPWVAVAATSAAFAAMHLGEARAGTWHAIAALFIFGAALGVAFERTRSLMVPVVMHVLFNLANILLTLVKT
ncbi:MAG: CPBP family intramembrane glutamic endopeptidase [Phycisphaerales bacterium]